MKKVVVASLLAVAGMAGVVRGAVAQTQVNLGTNAQANQGVQMSPAEYNAYNSAITQTDPKAKAAALEAYLTAYPQSAVKAATLEQLMLAYSAFDPAKTLDAADRLLQVDPNNLRGLTFETYFRLTGADSITDPTAKQAALDKAADYAQKGLAATKPADMSPTDFATLQNQAKPVFYRAIGTAALNKKDGATAVKNFKMGLAAVPVADTTKPGPLLQDTYTLGQAYYQSTPPDFLIDNDLRWYAENIATDFYSAYHRWFPDRPVNWLFHDAKELNKKDPSNREAFKRHPSLSDPVWLGRIHDRLVESVKRLSPYRPVFYDLGDESGIADLAAFWDFDFSDESLVPMRRWLRERYGTLAALNRQWGTTFTSWDLVMPPTTTEAMKRTDDNYSGWADFKE